jgi:hypothetical protein
MSRILPHTWCLPLGGDNIMCPHLKFDELLTYEEMWSLAQHVVRRFPHEFLNGKIEKPIELYPRSSFRRELNGGWNVIFKVCVVGGENTNNDPYDKTKPRSFNHYDYIICRDLLHGCTFCGPLYNYDYFEKVKHLPLTRGNVPGYFDLIDCIFKEYVTYPNYNKASEIHFFPTILNKSEYIEEYKKLQYMRDVELVSLRKKSKKMLVDKVPISEREEHTNSVREYVRNLFNREFRIKRQDEAYVRLKEYLDADDYGTPISMVERNNILPFDDPAPDEDDVVLEISQKIYDMYKAECRKNAMKISNNGLSILPHGIRVKPTKECAGCQRYKSIHCDSMYYGNGFCKRCFPTGYDGDKEIKNKSMTIKDALYMLFSHSTCFNRCSTPVFKFIRMHLKTHFPRLELKNPIPDKFNINRICNGYKILTVKNGLVTESTNLDCATRIIEVFMPEVKGPGEGDPVAKLYVNDSYNIGI